jgi:HSP20 family molecular chaperone IbpA
MPDPREMEKRQSSEVQRADREPSLVMQPPADVFEDAEGITLQLDMPGVSKDRLNLQANKNNTLLIEGNAHIDMPAGIAALYADVRSTSYRRSFVLSDELEADKTEANLKDGVLTVRIPKRAEVRPRRIEVQAG